VPISSRSLLENDPAGITKIKFAQHSPQARDWQRLSFSMRATLCSHAERIQDFFADTSLTVDTSQVTFIETPPAGRDDAFPIRSGFEIPHDSPYLRRRCDVFGLFLWCNGYRVEQQDQKLIVIPR
jgi:hypothetical protein